jgi:hypothetical protein
LVFGFGFGFRFLFVFFFFFLILSFVFSFYVLVLVLNLDLLCLTSFSYCLDDQGMSFTEFSYQILQSHDYLRLNQLYDCNLQFGGSDQWGNITSGIDYVKKKNKKSVCFFIYLFYLD